MKYNAEYDRWVTEEGKVYRQDKEGNYIECKPTLQKSGYYTLCCRKSNKRTIFVHRLVYETFYGKIPEGMEIDHEDTHKYNNALSNLILCTHKENCNNKLTRKHTSEARKGKPKSEFGKKFKEHYGLTRTDDDNLYCREYYYYMTYGKVRWE
jgi:hypothetical protein